MVIRNKLDRMRQCFSNAFWWTIIFGLITIFIALWAKKSGNPYIWSIGNFLSGIGNDVFLIGTNIIILIWAWRQRTGSIIKLTLGIDLLVGILVQGIKSMKIYPWYLRPNGGEGGFPSGHATHAFAMAFLLAMFFPRFSWLWFTAAAAISWSRVETDWHSGIQVAAGVMLGVFIAWGMISAWLKYFENTNADPTVESKNVQVSKVITN
ncbi:phosphatase PAP2 family protein [Sporomusa acidovorans]|uniref:Phosphatidic acid phosphatase type 2/haloperoxidase domain-containing protein n=1 Tax=Sporomusa acidovorans (strain ATCC 49682 / DSM 3132 / Mol) TaxID=1123286 RepID=A0ABZ3J254_SPOA4|nr:phosphatase PAP2 family protein [Sporomusa acidovorans]OZC14801.1 PAP2 superfamily protein [Sporomusa acidovorans DSM 3132]SDF86599.1 PAP2 superfamily protein [Sporomusa acidovorans]